MILRCFWFFFTVFYFCISKIGFIDCMGADILTDVSIICNLKENLETNDRILIVLWVTISVSIVMKIFNDDNVNNIFLMNVRAIVNFTIS